MPSSPASPEPGPAPRRPRVATVGVALWLVAAVLLMAGGLLTAAADVAGPNPALVRGVGVLIALAGAAMAYLTGRSRDDDPRPLRAAIALSVVIVVVVALTARFGLHVLTALGVVVLVIGTGLRVLSLRRGVVRD